MIPTLYEPFRHWSDGGSVYILSDLHFDDADWITPQEQIALINGMVMKNDTFICLGDVGSPEYIKDIKARKKILILGNHDAKGAYKNYFDEIYTGPLFIAEKILLSHEPVYGLPWCLNIHGHDHNNMEPYREGCKHINLAANVCGYTPINLGKIIKDGVLADVPSIHRLTIDRQVERKRGNDMYDENAITNALEVADIALKFLRRAQSMVNDIASISIIDIIINKAKVSIIKELLFDEAEHTIWDALDEIERLKSEVKSILRNQNMRCKYKRLACLMDSIYDNKYLNRVSYLRVNKALKRIGKVISQVEAIMRELERMQS